MHIVLMQINNFSEMTYNEDLMLIIRERKRVSDLKICDQRGREIRRSQNFPNNRTLYLKRCKYSYATVHATYDF